MKEVINRYKTNKFTVDTYLINLVKSLKSDYLLNSDEILKSYPFIQLIYSVDKDYKQVSPIICKKRKEIEHIGSDKSHYFMKMILNSENFYISNPYIHYRTGRASLSVVYFMDEHYYVFDINLIPLLESLHLIEYNSIHDKVKRAVYLFGSTTLSFISVSLIAYGAYIFASILFFYSNEVDFLHDVFKAIISITLGLAIFDLAKQIFEHEGLFKTFHHPEDKEYKVLGKFLISILVALSIETLLVVFKIALNDYSKLVSALYLLLGTTTLLVGLGWFYKTIKESSSKEDEH